MCNFIIRPINSYATVNVSVEVFDKDISSDNYVTRRELKRGTAVKVAAVLGDDHVNGYVELDGKEHIVNIPLDVFVRCFIANPDDIKKVKDEESEWFKSK